MASRTTERYRTDPEFRELQKKRARISYWRSRPLVERPPFSVFRTEYFGTVKIQNPRDVRFGQEVLVPVYRVGQYAELFGKSAQTIRLWTKDGRLPEPLFRLDEGGRRGRGYTYDQMRITWEYLPLLSFPDDRDAPPTKPDPGQFEKGRHDPDFKRAMNEWRGAMAEHRFDHNVFSRMLKEAWQLMPDGVLPCLKE